MIFEHSRHWFCQRWTDDSGNAFLDARLPYRFKVFPDNTTVLIRQGDSLFTIAGQHFAPLPRAAGLWWVIADFQPNPIRDPTIVLEPGTVLVLPSRRTLMIEIFSADRRQESRV